MGPFALAEVIGEGKRTGLYRAVRVDGTRSPRQVAIRAALDPSDPTAADRVHREYEILRVLDDPRIPKAYGHYPESAAMAMGFVDGITLADIIIAASRDWVTLEPATALDIAIEVAHALRHAHAVRFGTGSRIVHGHLGPQRIRLEPTGAVVLVGIGAATRGRHPAYCAPEVAAGGLPTRISDQWSLGATLLEMLLGERLYAGRRDPDEAAKDGDVRLWLDRLDRKHPEVSPAVRKMLARHPDDRFHSEPEMLKALLSASRRMGGTVHRRHLVAQVLIHADKLEAMRPDRPPVTPLPLPHTLGPRAPEVMEGHAPHPEPEVWSMTDETRDAPPPVESDPDAAPPAEPTPVEVSMELDSPPMSLDIPIDGPDEAVATEPTELIADEPEITASEPEVTASEPEVPADEPEVPVMATPPTSEPAVATNPDNEPTAPLFDPDEEADHGPEPTAPFLPSEVVGMVAGVAMIALGIWYCLKVL